MMQDFEKHFWKKIGYTPGILFGEAYAAYNFGEYEIKKDFAYLNDCDGSNYSWLVLDTYAGVKPSTSKKCYTS